MVACARGGHVEQALALGGQGRDLARLDPVLPAGRHEATEIFVAQREMQSVLGRIGHGRDLLGALAFDVAQRDDRKLEALGGVDGQHAHHVVALLGDGRVGIVVLLVAHALQPAGEAPQCAAARGRERLGGLHHLEDVRGGLFAAGQRQCRLHQPGALDRRAHQLGQR